MYFPKKKVKLNKNIHKLEPWFSNGLLVSRRRKLYLAKCAARNPTLTNKNAYSVYRNLYNIVIRTSKKMYYENELKKHKSNLKVTWDLLRKAIRKNKSKNLTISTIKVNGIEINDPKVIGTVLMNFLRR
jgi:hypothetical protein